MSFASTISDISAIIKGFFTHAESETTKMIARIERKISQKGLALKRFLARTAIEIFVLLFGIGSLLLGLLILFSRIAPIDIVLIIVGVLLVNGVLLLGKFK